MFWLLNLNGKDPSSSGQDFYIYVGNILLDGSQFAKVSQKLLKNNDALENSLLFTTYKFQPKGIYRTTLCSSHTSVP